MKKYRIDGKTYTVRENSIAHKLIKHCTISYISIMCILAGGIYACMVLFAGIPA